MVAFASEMRRVMRIAPANVARLVDCVRFAAASALSAGLFVGFAAADGDCGQGLRFEDAEISVVVDEIARRTGARFILDPDVAGRVTIASSAAGGLCPEEALGVFLEALPAYGFAATPVTSGAYRIAPAAAGDAAQSAQSATVNPSGGASGLGALRQDSAAPALTVALPQAAVGKQGPSSPIADADAAAVTMESVFFGAHLSSYRTQASAIAGWKELLAQYPVELDAMTAKLARFSDPAKGDFERIIAGPFPSRAEAAKFCGRLHGAGAYCAVMPFSGRPLPE